MRNKFYKLFILLSLSTGLYAQQPGTGTAPGGKPTAQPIRIVDTLTTAEKINRDPVLLKTELDSLVSVFLASRPQQVVREAEKGNTADTNPYMMAGLLVITALLILMIVMIYRHRVTIHRVIAGLQQQQQKAETDTGNGRQAVAKDKKGKAVPPSLETKISNLHDELHKLTRENEGLNRVIKEYNGIQHEYDSLKHGILKAYKVKNYPGYDQDKNETLAMQGVLQTEQSVAAYAYEKFLKPILTIADANKNNPARIPAADQEKLLDLLVSLSLLYIEYLYLRVNELSIGGTMVERIQGLSKGNGLDAALLKKLNTDFGSRALVIKLALNKTGLHRLSYPVFDETNLNNQ